MLCPVIDTLWVVLTDVVDGACTELSIELFGSEASEVVDGEGPEVQHIVPGEGVSLFHHHHLAAEQGQLDGRPQAAGAPADDQTLGGDKEEAHEVFQKSTGGLYPQDDRNELN